MTKKFETIQSPFGVGIDERKTTEAFVDYVGGTVKADRLLYLWGISHGYGTKHDFLMGKGITRKQNFRRKAKEEGFTDEQVDAFFLMQ